MLDVICVCQLKQIILNFTIFPCVRVSVSMCLRQHVSNFPLLVPSSFLSSASLHGMTFHFLSDRSPLLTALNQSSIHFFSQNYRPAMFSVPCCCLHPSHVSVCCPFYVVCKFSSVVYSQYARVYRDLCVYVCVYALRTVSTDTILSFINS